MCWARAPSAMPAAAGFPRTRLRRRAQLQRGDGRIIDEEIKKIVDEAHDRAVQLLTENKDVLVRVAEALIERETIDGERTRHAHARRATA